MEGGLGWERGGALRLGHRTRAAAVSPDVLHLSVATGKGPRIYNSAFRDIVPVARSSLIFEREILQEDQKVRRREEAEILGFALPPATGGGSRHPAGVGA